LHFYSAVPQASEFLDPQPLSKGKTEKTKSKKKDSGKGGAGQSLDSTGFMTLPAPQMQSYVNSQSPAPSGFSSIMPASGSISPPAMKPGFSRISSATDTPTQTGTSVPSERTKVAFGFGSKRKAADDFMQPPSKRR
jgi:U4/U6.U5 tri-snRNP-associated protein 1